MGVIKELINTEEHVICIMIIERKPIVKDVVELMSDPELSYNTIKSHQFK